MDFEEKTSDLLALLTAHVKGFSPVIAVMPRPPTPATARTSLAEATNKKRKHGQGGKGSEGAEEGEIVEPSAKEALVGKGQQKKKPKHTRTSKEVDGNQHKKASI